MPPDVVLRFAGDFKGLSRSGHAAGVSLTLADGKARPALTHIRHLGAVVTYGRPRYMVMWMGDPPRRILTRYLYWATGKRATRTFLAQ